MSSRFGSLLVANRGEIAVRVMRTAAALGIRTVAVHTDADRTAPHARAADEALRIGSYLDVQDVVDACVRAGADAVHPGYGFLSERAELARAAEAAGVVFVGPSAEVIDLMGRKDTARDAAVAAGVPVVPTGADELPVLVKAVAGGGGKGMRVVRSAGELPEAVAAVRREAMAAFGDDAVLLERYLEGGRHVEVQVLADGHGSVLHLGDRDCSAQRRHQKVLEEAPAPGLSDAVRTLLRRSSVALARRIGYVGAGTVEFLVRGEEAFFLEMNTRLQVEHPVTELVTGLDLVELQLRVAEGSPLGFGQDDVSLRGHAMEARVYAEDPYAGFLPQAGRAEIVRWPTGVRVDHALEDGQEVGTSYDPMLAKVVVHGPTREAARHRLVDALEATAILGLTTNTGFLRDLAAGEELRDMAVDTAWLDEHPPEPPSPDTARLLAAWTRAMLTSYTGAGPWRADGFRLGGPPAPQVVELDRPVVVDRATGLVDGTPVVELSAADHVLEVLLDGRRERAVVNATAERVEVAHRGHRFVFEPPDAAVSADVAASADGAVRAPMPGVLRQVHVAAGDSVEAGDRLVTVEAMKMELAMTAPSAGTVTSVVPAGSTVTRGQVLVQMHVQEDR